MYTKWERKSLLGEEKSKERIKNKWYPKLPPWVEAKKGGNRKVEEAKPTLACDELLKCGHYLRNITCKANVRG